MSARGRKRAERRATSVAAFEFYPTPREAITPLITSSLLTLPGGTWIDPCAGSGRIPSTVNGLRDDVAWLLVEIDPGHMGALCDTLRTDRDELLSFGDFVIRDWTHPRADVAIMNPPFSHALEFVQACMARAATVAMLQRTNWIGPSRAAWLRRHMPDVYQLAKRPSFTGDGSTDAAEYSWFVWPAGEHDRRWGRVAMLEDAAAHVQPDLMGAP